MFFIWQVTSSVQQDADDHNLNHRNNRSSTSNQSSNACSKHTSYYEPCECLDLGDGNIKLDCRDISRDKSADTKVSRILKLSLRVGLNQLIRELQSGFRMDKPQYATNDINQLMINCWKADPNERLTFQQLQEILGIQLEASLIADGHYMEITNL